MKLRIAIVGCGYVFDHYMATAAAHMDLEIAAVWDIDAARLATVAAHYTLHAAASYREILDDASIALVVNLTAIESHFDVTHAALMAGKHVYSEKPLTTDLASARALFALARARGLMLMAAPCNMFSDTVQTMWRAVIDGAVGRPLLVYAEFDDNPVYLMKPEGWRSRTGAPWPWRHEYAQGCTTEHLGYHLVWMCALFGPAKSVTAFSKLVVPHKCTDGPQAADFSVACIDFVSGVTARVTCSIAAPSNHRMCIIGDEGELSTDTYRHYQSPVYLERFSALNLNARKLRTVRNSRGIGGLFGVGGKMLPLVQYPWSHATRRGTQRGALSPLKTAIAALKRREVGSQDKMLGVALTARAIVTRMPAPASPEFLLHITELTLAVQNAGTAGSAYQLSTRFEPMAPLPGTTREPGDYRARHRPSLIERYSERVIETLHQH